MTTQATPREANVYVSTYDPAVLTYLWPEWPALDSKEKLGLLRAYSPGPREEARQHNQTTRAFHQFLTRTIDPEQSPGRDGVAYLLAGRGGAGGTSSYDDSMNLPIGSPVEVTDTVYTATSAEVQVTTFVDSTQLNGYTIDEVGIQSEQGDLWNHAVLASVVDKTAAKTMVVDVFFAFSNPA